MAELKIEPPEEESTVDSFWSWHASYFILTGFYSEFQ
ncbi:MAG: hypothetical protein ACLPVO_17545 [Desulfomonilaceae bacterium]